MRVFVVGLPKTGTTTLTEALKRSGYAPAHWRVPEGHVGAVVDANLRAGRPVFAGLEAYDAITQADVCLPAKGLNVWPNLDVAVLDRIRAEHPGCVFVLNTRAPEKTIRSIRRWGTLHRRLIRAAVPGLPAGRGRTDEELRAWIEAHYAAMRARYGGRPGFVEFDIEDPAAPETLGAALGTPIRWWGRRNESDAVLGTAEPVPAAAPRRRFVRLPLFAR